MTAQIPLTGSVGPTGPFAILGFSLPVITGNADHVLSVAEYSSTSLKVTSDGASLAIRKVVAPLAPGMLFLVENLTSEGLAITVGGASGTAVTVPSGSTVLVTCPDGANYVAPGGGAGSATIVANAAALTALPASGLPNGTQAVVQTFGALFALSPAGPAVDGVTVIAASDARVWQRGPSLIAEAAAAQTAWFVDPQNSSGTASDENSGLTTLLPLVHKAEVYRRWGYTWSAKLNSISVVVTYLSPDVTGSTDPGLFAPELGNGATFLQTAALPAATFTGTLLAVTPKSVAGNQALAATFTTTTGALAVRMLLVNATRANSEAWAVRNAAGTWTLTQPLAAWVPGTSAVRAAVNTWANGDAISGYVPMTVATSVVAGVLSAYDATFSPGHAVWHLLLADLGTSSFGLTQMTVHNECFPGLIACDIERPALLDLEQGGVSGCVFGSNGANINSQGGNGYVQGGWIPSGDLRCQFLNDPIVAGTLHDSFIATANNVYVDLGQTLTVQGQENLTGTAAIYGPGTLNVKGYLTTSGTAVATLPIATKHLNGVATGYSNATAAGVTTVHGGIALTSANIDAAAGAAGFGGLAYTPGATIAVTTVQP